MHLFCGADQSSGSGHPINQTDQHSSHCAIGVHDDGLITVQNLARISHRDQVEDLVACGSDLERLVISPTICWHLAGGFFDAEIRRRSQISAFSNRSRGPRLAHYGQYFSI